jgi:hypothetical protein
LCLGGFGLSPDLKKSECSKFGTGMIKDRRQEQEQAQEQEIGPIGRI